MSVVDWQWILTRKLKKVKHKGKQYSGEGTFKSNQDKKSHLCSSEQINNTNAHDSNNWTSLSRWLFRVHTPDWNKNLCTSVLRAASIAVKGCLNESTFYRLIFIWKLGQSSGQSCFSSLLHLKYESLIANMCCVWVAGGNSSASEALDKKKYSWLVYTLGKKKSLAIFTPLEVLGSLYY